MAERIIKLGKGVWHFDDAARLGPAGGFGAVFQGKASDGSPVAVKRLHIEASEAAHRELAMAVELDRPFVHVMRVLDAGQDADSDQYYVVMPRAERSLHDFICAEGAVSESEAIPILLQIAEGLTELSQIVHRDLKPGNVLWHDGSWKIADFGIARFVEESTSLQTLKGCLSPPYAAPEQWRLERASGATDVYALGCIAFALLTGAPPFPGPDYRDQHLQSPIPTLNGFSSRIASLVGGMLKKEGALRPNLGRIIEQLKLPISPPRAGSGAHALSRVSAAVSAQQAALDAQEAEAREAESGRRRLAKAAFDELVSIGRALFGDVQEHAPAAEVEEIPQGQGPYIFRASLGNGSLRMAIYRPEMGATLERSNWDVVAEGAILVELRGRYKRSASLWFSDHGFGNGYRWYELSFMTTFSSSPEPNHAPFTLRMEDRDADLAIAPIMHTHQLGSPVFPIDNEAQSDFMDRWLERFSQAAAGTLRSSGTLPTQD